MGYNVKYRNGNSTMMETKQADAREFTASDVKASAGLSYRQLNNLGFKGVLSSSREGKVGWRKFTPREVFRFMVCGNSTAIRGAA